MIMREKIKTVVEHELRTINRHLHEIKENDNTRSTIKNQVDIAVDQLILSDYNVRLDEPTGTGVVRGTIFFKELPETPNYDQVRFEIAPNWNFRIS